MRIQSVIRGKNNFNSPILLNMPISTSRYSKTFGNLLIKQKFSTSHNISKTQKTSRRFRNTLLVSSTAISLIGAQYYIDEYLPSEKLKKSFPLAYDAVNFYLLKPLRFINPMSYYFKHDKAEQMDWETPSNSLGSSYSTIQHNTVPGENEDKNSNFLISTNEISSEQLSSNITAIDSVTEMTSVQDFSLNSENNFMNSSIKNKDPMDSYGNAPESDLGTQFIDLVLSDNEDQRQPSILDLNEDLFVPEKYSDHNFSNHLQNSESDNCQNTTININKPIESDKYEPSDSTYPTDTCTIAEVVKKDSPTLNYNETLTPSSTDQSHATESQFTSISPESNTPLKPTSIKSSMTLDNENNELYLYSDHKSHLDYDTIDPNQISSDAHFNVKTESSNKELSLNSQNSDVQLNDDHYYDSSRMNFNETSNDDTKILETKNIKTEHPEKNFFEPNDCINSTNHELLLNKLNQINQTIAELQNLKKEEEEIKLKNMLEERIEKLEAIYKANWDSEKNDWLAERQKDLEQKYEILKASHIEILNKHKDELQKSYVESSTQEKEMILNQMAMLSATVDTFEKESLNAINEAFKYKRLNKLILLSIKIQNQLDSNEPIAFIINTLTEFKSDPIVNKVIESIPKELFDTEDLLLVPTLYSLQKKFDNKLKACIVCSFESPNQNFIQRLSSRILGRLYIFRKNHLISDESSNLSKFSSNNGDNSAEKNLQALSKLAFYLQNEKLAEAIKSTDALEGGPKDILKDWINDAHLTLQVKLALIILTSHLRLMNSSLELATSNN